MGRNRVLMLAPALARMQCTGHPYKLVEGEEPTVRPSVGGAGAGRSFWLWKKKKSVKVDSKENPRSRRKWGLRVSRLRIHRLVSPLVYRLKKCRDAYVNMMLAFERINSAGMVMGAYPVHPANPSLDLAAARVASDDNEIKAAAGLDMCETGHSSLSIPLTSQA